jgi:hypothetical protein
MLAALSFSDAAAYFEVQVQREGDESRQAEFDDAARFYRELAEIMPSFPIGYYGTFWDARAGLDSRAEQCRSLAAVVRDAERQAKLLRLAGTYRRAAEIRGRPPL